MQSINKSHHMLSVFTVSHDAETSSQWWFKTETLPPKDTLEAHPHTRKLWVPLCVYPESSVSSPLSWLLSEYLDNTESARRCKSRAAIFNSRVRRLTHLLVHVDTSRPDGEELKPPVKSSESETPDAPETPARFFPALVLFQWFVRGEIRGCGSWWMVWFSTTFAPWMKVKPRTKNKTQIR